jgi:hypothetical protein
MMSLTLSFTCPPNVPGSVLAMSLHSSFFILHSSNKKLLRKTPKKNWKRFAK